MNGPKFFCLVNLIIFHFAEVLLVLDLHLEEKFVLCLQVVELKLLLGTMGEDTDWNFPVACVTSLIDQKLGLGSFNLSLQLL